MEHRSDLLPEGCHELRMRQSVPYLGRFPLVPGGHRHGMAGTVAVGLQARRHTLVEGDLAMLLLLAVVNVQLEQGDEPITVEVIDQSDRQEIDHETW